MVVKGRRWKSPKVKDVDVVAGRVNAGKDIIVPSYDGMDAKIHMIRKAFFMMVVPDVCESSVGDAPGSAFHSSCSCCC